MDVRERLAANMVRLRSVKEWSQEQLAEEAGLHRTYVSGVERRVRNPTITVAAKIAAAFGCGLGDLLDHQPPADALPPKPRRGRRKA